jgi:hypothetical protein
MIALQDLKKRISKKLESSALSPKILKSHFKIGTDRPVYLFDDPTYMPMYYQLGKILNNTKTLLEFGFDLGMPSGCFIKGCPDVEHFLAFRKKDDLYYSKRLGAANIHNIWKKKFDFWIGQETDAEFVKAVLLQKWDCVIIADQGKKEGDYRSYLDLVWNQMRSGGVVVIDFLKDHNVRDALQKFCRLQNRESMSLETIRGTGILQK